MLRAIVHNSCTTALDCYIIASEKYAVVNPVRLTIAKLYVLAGRMSSGYSHGRIRGSICYRPEPID